MPAKIESKNEQFVRDLTVPTKGNVIPYGDIIDRVRTQLSNQGYTIASEDYKVTSTGTIANGIYYLEDKVAGTPGLRWMFTWSSTYDKSQKFKCGIGVYTTPGENIFYMDSSIYSSHPSQEINEVNNFITYMINDIKMASGEFISLIDAFVGNDLNMNQIAEVLGRLFIVEGAINLSQLSVITSKIQSNMDMFELYKVVSTAMNDTHPSSWIDNHTSLYQFFFVYTAELNEIKTVTKTTANIDKPVVLQVPIEQTMPIEPVEYIDYTKIDSGLKTVLFL